MNEFIQQIFGMNWMKEWANGLNARAFCLNQNLHWLRWLLIADRARFVSVANSLGTFNTKDLVAARDEHWVCFLFSAVITVTFSLRLTSTSQERVCGWSWCGWRWTWANDTVRIRKRPNVDGRITNSFIAVNRIIFISHCLPQINQLGSDHHRSRFGRCWRVGWASWAASWWCHLSCLTKLTILIFQV